ncbi:transposable element Tcb2 transposase [Trichonephila clavipes]|nr:transposable element Tcb2 transposase [Trichonephila clavipes]
MDDPICYELRVISIATGKSVKCCNPKSFPSFKVSLELSFSRITHAHMFQTVRDFSSAQHMQLLSWSAYSPDMSPIAHGWDLVSRRLVRDPHPAASKDELLLRILAIRNSVPEADIQNLFDSMPRGYTKVQARGGYTKY